MFYSNESQVQTPEYSTRENVLKRVRTAIERIGVGRPTKSVIMVGRRGVEQSLCLACYLTRWSIMCSARFHMLWSYGRYPRYLLRPYI